ncbi:hypothetical protein [Gelidibacter sp.]|uniref:hypothetical protein n=1 Tax=Gelidibacter sp. TaxID=2018083 RepID=UPI002CD94C47|nr:hypothetical protein [Gelidibacter sp.]HUH26978.1 hypothetical protein [Gelidibacter sp.]
MTARTESGGNSTYKGNPEITKKLLVLLPDRSSKDMRKYPIYQRTFRTISNLIKSLGWFLFIFVSINSNSLK